MSESRGNLPAVNRRVIISCEHGGNMIPAAFRPLFKEKRDLLESHRGYDMGALSLAGTLHEAVESELIVSRISRLLVDCNRSPWSRNLFGAPVAGLDAARKEKILQEYYRPYRRSVEEAVGRVAGKGGTVLHVSVHSFTPVLKGQTRRADIGLLYDPSRRGERELSLCWGRALVKEIPGLAVRRNYPYRGISDGMTSYLRKRYGDDRYMGLELEVNQKHLVKGNRFAERIVRGIVSTFLLIAGELHERRGVK